MTDGSIGAYQVSVYKKHGEIHQNPCREHEDDGVKAQDVEQPQVVDPSVSQHLLKEKSVGKLKTKPFGWNETVPQEVYTKKYRFVSNLIRVSGLMQ